MKKTLEIEESTARQLYKSASVEFKKLLEENFGLQFFSEKITDRIKTFEDVLKESFQWFDSVKNDAGLIKTKIQRSVYDILLNHVRGNRVTSDDKIRLITFVFNEGWEPDFNNHNEYKYYPYFQKTSSGWVLDVGIYDYSFSNVGSGFHYKNRELALCAGKQFLEIYKDYLPA